MNISFRPLLEKDFPVLLKWLETPHVKAWWDSEVSWSLEKVTAKYESYVSQYKLEKGHRRPIFSYIIVVDGCDAGYIQYYRARDFLTVPDSLCLPLDLAALDMYVAEVGLLGKGVGSSALSQFIKEVVCNTFTATLVTPDKHNVGAIACYKKAGFQLVSAQVIPNEAWLLYES